MPHPTSTFSRPGIEVSQGRGAPLHEPRYPPYELPFPFQRQVSQPPGADCGVLPAAVERRERRDPLERVRYGSPARDAQVIPSGEGVGVEGAGSEYEASCKGSKGGDSTRTRLSSSLPASYPPLIHIFRGAGGHEECQRSQLRSAEAVGCKRTAALLCFAPANPPSAVTS
jgi:hypothetical protein